ncbi:MAG: UDP-4-amino-4,6-dideoxy-N-acetyl-beta-L-altrosamine N-acetyltransferase [Idiomarina sp.]|nr:UDP-4-amino-4,6-dideoxy-N-acetyl-beta-L-altrosamine N-acetyltransferase [Idiomarina sp.]
MSKSILRAVTEQDLPTLRQWRNHPDIKRFMYTQHEITEAEHQSWFARMQDNPDVHLCLYMEDGKAMGYAQLTRHGHRAGWGFYVAPDAEKGTGRKLGHRVLDYAFSDLKLEKVCGEALRFNEASIAFHQALGFTHEGTLRAHAYVNNDAVDVLCFGLLKAEWLAKQK